MSYWFLNCFHASFILIPEVCTSAEETKATRSRSERVGKMRLHSMLKVISRSVRHRGLCTKTTEGTAKPKSTSSTGPGAVNIADVAGVSPKVMSIPNSEVGPGASKSSSYKNPEYYCYNPFSYAQAEAEMIKYRLPQPSNKAA